MSQGVAGALAFAPALAALGHPRAHGKPIATVEQREALVGTHWRHS